MKDFETGEILDGRYEVLSLLGKGGMGRVYRARQINLDRTVAIKVPSEAVLNNEEYIERFLREAQTCARIAHDNIVAIYDVHEGTLPYIVMEFVDGMQLNHYLHERSRVLSVADLIEMSRQISEGLHAAHSRGIVHRDIKPANIFITRESQRVKIMDFGIARVEGLTSLTMTGAMMGTPFYMAPEQIRGGEVTAATDIYALACLVYQLFTGVLVFDGKLPELIFKHVNEEPVPPSRVNTRLPRAVDDVVLKGLCKDPASRYQSAREFHAELAESLKPICNWSVAALLGKSGTSDGEGVEPIRLPGVPAGTPGGKRGTPVVGPTELLMPGQVEVGASAAAAPPGGAVTPSSKGAAGKAVVSPLPNLRSRQTIRLVGAAFALVVLIGGGYFAWNLVQKRKDAGKGVASESGVVVLPTSGAAGSATAPEPSPPRGRADDPSTAASASVRLDWAVPGMTECLPGKSSYRRGEYVMVWVKSDPIPSSLSPLVRRVVVKEKNAEGKVRFEKPRTIQDRISIPVGPDWPAGEYRLTVEIEPEAGVSAKPLEADFVVAGD
ncbi:serine/threonine protein kinase [Candidatus Sumerlaeota bacterium]|nr:serine/threonine protein kinase [Candidatus Sumerlaeota bacterium]